jgi:hypothetical protein
MVRRLKKDKDSHDACVSVIAEELRKDKWEVNANLEGWKKPSRIGSFVPDVEAKKEGCLTRICEVATKEMFDGDKKRYLEFKNYCDEYDFHFYLMKDGKRVKIDPNDLSNLTQR